MSGINVTTTKSEKVWVSKDSDRTIWEVTLKADDGKEYKLKTYSAKISEEGYKGEVRSYVNPRGERFVRQVPQDNNQQRPGFTPRDDSHIRAQWAIGQAVSVFPKIEKDAPDSEADRVAYINAVENLAKEFFLMADRVKQTKPLAGEEDE